MGCEVFYNGQLSNPILQEKVIELVYSYYKKDCYVIRPEPETYYHTWYLGKKPPGKYPFNFFGVIPKLDEDNFLDRGQFVFDRNNGGKLVTLNKIPGSYKSAWDEIDGDAEFDVIVDNGGYYINIESSPVFLFLLNLIEIKWWPEFNYGEDCCLGKDFTCEDSLLFGFINSDIVDVLKKESLDFDAAWELYLQSGEQDDTEQKKDNIGDQLLFSEEALEDNNLKSEPRFIHPNPEEVSIDAMDLSVRSNICLEKSGVKNLGQLLKYSKKELIAIRNLTRKAAGEIIRKVRNYGYDLRDDD